MMVVSGGKRFSMVQLKYSLKSLDFLQYMHIYFGISLVVLSISFISLLLFQLRPGIDFTGGSLIELAIDAQVDPEELQADLADIANISNIQPSDGGIILRGKDISSEKNSQIQALIEANYGPVEEIRFETVGPTLGQELLRKTLYAVLLGSLAIMAYVAYQFKQLMYGACAILAMLHDTFIVIGIFSLLGHFYGVEVDTLFVTAILTTLSFSIHDTIVVYDRIRESLHRSGIEDFKAIVNKAIAETLSRSINNSMTIIFMLTALFLLGGESIRWFVFALLIGTITGTYSSTFTAAPLLVLWQRIQRRTE